MSLRNVLDSAVNAIEDLSSLEVQTYVGLLDVTVDAEDSRNLEALLKQARVSGNLQLVQVTRLSIDGDGTNLVSPDPQPEHVVRAHQAALEAGNHVRAGILELFSGLIDKR